MQPVLARDPYLARLRAVPKPGRGWAIKERPYHIWFKIVDEVDAGKPDQPSIRFIQEAVCDHYGVSFGELVSNRRHIAIIMPRHIAMYLAKVLTTKSFPTIGRAFGARDHSSPMFGYNKIVRLMASDSNLAEDVEGLQTYISKKWGKS